MKISSEGPNDGRNVAGLTEGYGHTNVGKGKSLSDHQLTAYKYSGLTY
jgi:hypothetical protein